VFSIFSFSSISTFTSSWVIQPETQNDRRIAWIESVATSQVLANFNAAASIDEKIPWRLRQMQSASLFPLSQGLF
jgi:hypothetical protein